MKKKIICTVLASLMCVAWLTSCTDNDDEGLQTSTDTDNEIRISWDDGTDIT